MPLERIALLDDLSADDRARVRLAIVADPDPEDLSRLPALEWVHSTWAGVERMVAELAPDLPIVRLTDPQLADTMAEAVLAAVLWLHRHGPRYARQQRARVWKAHDIPQPFERRVTILGLGKLGSHAAEKLGANGFAVSGWSRTPKPEAAIPCYHGVEGMRAALDADIVVSLLPRTTETERIMDAEAFATMPRGSAFVNFGRGATVDEAALVDALDRGHIADAVLDVFATEPLPDDHPFWTNERVTVWPHVSAPTNERTAAAVIADAVCRWRDTGDMPVAVNRGRGY